MSYDLPRLLIVTEVSFSAEGMGANRTLFNLFDTYPSERLMLFIPESSLKNQSAAPPFNKRITTFPGYYFPPLKNRIGLFIHYFIATVNLQLLDLLPIANQKSLESFNPELILVSPLTSWCLLMGHKLATHFHCPSLIYIMDDWLVKANYQWLSGSTQKVAYQLLKESDGWLMISEQLQADLTNRYQLLPKNSLIVHNPVDLSIKEPPAEQIAKKNTFKIAYAGSILQLHYDALALIAEAIYKLRCEGQDIELILYTAPFFWEQNKQKWQQWEVIYGSLIPYNELTKHLEQADLLLVTSSFLPELAHAIRSSVFTKLTDYMAVGKPIFSCGPTYSACNQFVSRWQCGIVCDSNHLEDVKQKLLNLLKDRETLNKVKHKGLEVVKKHFSKEIITKSLYSFIKDRGKLIQPKVKL